MSNTATLEAPEIQTTTLLVVESRRGPCLAERKGLTIYPIYEYLKAG